MISVTVTINQNSHVLPLLLYIGMLLESPNYVSSTGSKKLAHRFLNISCSGRQGGELFFYLVNLKLVPKPMWISNS